MIERSALTSGELYWLRIRPDGNPFIAEYQSTNKTRDGHETGPCFRVGTQEVFGDYDVLEHIKKPEPK